LAYWRLKKGVGGSFDLFDKLRTFSRLKAFGLWTNS